MDDLIVIRTDGGASSQLAFCALGKFFEDKGYRVKYDITWFKECGVNIPGGKYIIDKAFPDLEIEFATDDEVKIYRKKYTVPPEQSTLDITPPAYIGGYRQDSYFLLQNKDFYVRHFKPKEFSDMTSPQYHLFKEIQSTNSCGIHCRRGDLSEYHPVYGSPASMEYFLETINIINQTNKEVVFYFFSDTPEWVEENIITQLNSDIKYKICKTNDRDSGYLDFYLLTWCRFIISSHGSLGVMAKILSKYNDTKLWMCKNRDYMESADLQYIYIYICPQTIIPAKKHFKEFVLEIPETPDDKNRMYKKYRKYRFWFKVFLSISIILTIMFVILLWND